MYLVIPELPDKQPEWFPVFERALVASRANDISFLVDILAKSHYGSLIKASKSKEGIPVTVQKGNPYAIPIEPQYLKNLFQILKIGYTQTLERLMTVWTKNSLIFHQLNRYTKCLHFPIMC